MPLTMLGKMFKKDKARTTKKPERSRRSRIFWSYAPDWALTILLWGLFYLLDKVDGYRRLFDITDTSLAHPYADPERVPVWLAGVLTALLPALVIIVIAAVHGRSFWDGHNGILGLVLSLGLAVTFTNIIKVTAGRPRPDLFARCILPDTLTSNPTHGLTSWTACTTDDAKRLREGFRSFPSGHSSFAWCGMWYLILYLSAKMRINNRKGFTWKSWLLLAPLSNCTLITVSRTMDYRHHSTDVIAGSLIGVLCAWWCYRQYYPALSHPQAHKPYSPRIPRDESHDLALPLHQRSSRNRNHDSHDTCDSQPFSEGTRLCRTRTNDVEPDAMRDAVFVADGHKAQAMDVAAAAEQEQEALGWENAREQMMGERETTVQREE